MVLEATQKVVLPRYLIRPGSTYTSRHADVLHCLKSLAGWAADTFKEASCRFFKHTEMPIQPFQQSANLWIGSGPSSDQQCTKKIPLYINCSESTTNPFEHINRGLLEYKYCMFPAGSTTTVNSVNCAFSAVYPRGPRQLLKHNFLSDKNVCCML